jgi:hypothetical protein
VGIGAGHHGFAVLMGPSGRAQVGIDATRQPVDMDEAPFNRVDAVGVGLHRFSQATGVGIKGMGREHERVGLAQPQGADLVPRGLRDEIALLQIQHDEMAAIDFGFHAGDEEDAALAGVGDGFRQIENLAVPRDGDGVEPYFLRLIDMLENGMREIPVNRVALAMAVKLDAISWHGWNIRFTLN